MTILLQRNYKEKQTLGFLVAIDSFAINFQCKTLELPNLNNTHNTSCIPEGDYLVTKEEQKERGKVLRVHDVLNRKGILFHKGNFNKDTLGCILPGDAFLDINNDGLQDVVNSGKTMDALYDILDDENTLIITS